MSKTKNLKRGRPPVAHPVRNYPTVRIDPQVYARAVRLALEWRMSIAHAVNELVKIGLEMK